jgi:hypothetical protein
MKITFTVSAIGFMARRLLDSEKPGRVAAVFERSFYVDFNGSFLCLAAASAGIDPLTGRCDVGETQDPFDRIVAVGDPATVDRRGVHVGSRLFFSVTRAQTWHPPSPPRWSADSLGRGLKALSEIEAARLPKEGLGLLARGLGSDLAASREASYARVPALELRDWLAGAFAREADCDDAPPPSVATLIGLGPGLTPSGDDFLGGAMIAAHLLHGADVVRRLYLYIAPEAERATHPISRAHLQAASEGAGGASLHAALNAILAGDLTRLPGCLEMIGRVGHTSGWDALAGAASTLRAWRGTSVAVGAHRHCNLVHREYTGDHGIGDAGA